MARPRRKTKQLADTFKVLVVDDDEAVQDLLESVLTEDGLKVTTCYDGESALTLVSSDYFNLILVDLKMPSMSGQDLIRELHKRNITSKIIVISGTDSYADIVDSYEAGTDYFITKPIDIDYSRVIIHRALENIEFFSQHWSAIRGQWSAGVPKQRLMSEKNIVEDTEAFINRIPVKYTDPKRHGLLNEPRIVHPFDANADPIAARPGPLETIAKGLTYDVLATRLDEETRSFRQQVAASLLPALKDEMRKRPHSTYDEKKDLVHWTNAELKRFNLAIKHPKTGQPSAFKPKPGNDPAIGSFELSSKDDDGREKTFTTPYLETLLENFELMEAPPRREGLSEWHEKVSGQPRGRRRG